MPALIFAQTFSIFFPPRIQDFLGQRCLALFINISDPYKFFIALTILGFLYIKILSIRFLYIKILSIVYV